MPPDDENADRDPLALLRALRSDMPAPSAAARKVFDRLLLTIPGGMSESTPKMSSEPSCVPGAPSNETIFSSHALRAGHLFSNGGLRNGVALVARPWAWAVGLTLAGGVTGGALHAVFAPESVRVVYVERPSPALPALRDTTDEARTPASGSQNPEALVSPAKTAPSTLSERHSPPEQPASGATSADSALAKERALLDAARRALGSGDPRACLTELAKHARAFPAGKLAEERDAMAVNALVAVGRYSEAREKADLFARRYAHSFLQPSVEAAIAAIP
jgi:hypothetical protein